MAGITLVQAQERLADWLAADKAVSRNQSYSLDQRTLTRADAATIRENIKFWNDQVKVLTSGSGRKVTKLVVG